MPLFLNNDEIAELITMRDTMEALEILYREMGEGAAVTIAAPREESSAKMDRRNLMAAAARPP